jgi:hypothetical protein
VYQVAPNFYGPGSPYKCYAGVDCSRNLGKAIVGVGEQNADWRSLSPEHMADLDSWVALFNRKYTVVGWLIEDDEFRKRAEAFEP